MSKIIVPLKFGPESEVEIPRSEGPLYRRLRRMSKHPRQPAIWSKEKFLLPFAIISAPLFLTWWIDTTKDYFLGRGQGLIQVIVPLYPLLISLFMLAYGLWRRFGVDDDRVWTRFGKVFYREVRFSEVTRFRTGVERYKLNTADSVVNVDYNKYDYSLVSYGLLRELQKRRFELPHNVRPENPDWEQEAQLWRNILAQDIFDEHSEFLLAHPEELAYLNSLTEPPAAYEEDTVSVDVVRPLVFEAGFVPVESSRVFARYWFRRSKVDPLQPRKFSYFWQVVPVGLLGFLLFGLVTLGEFSLFATGRQRIVVFSIFASTAAVFGVFLFYGLLRRFGVDEQRVWSGFGFLRQEVKFSEVTGVCLEGKYVKVSAGRRVLRVNFGRFDYALALFGLLRELGKRRFIVDGVVPGEPGWERRAQIWRNMLGAMIFEDHSGYLLEHPAKLAYLNQLMQPPVTYED